MSESTDITLTRSEAVVLFEFLSRISGEGEWCIEDSAELQALWQLLAHLEKALSEPFSPEYRNLLNAAREELRPNGGTDASSEAQKGRLAVWLEPKLIEFLGNEWRKIPSEANEEQRKYWSVLAFRAMSALHKAGIEYEPKFPEASECYRLET